MRLHSHPTFDLDHLRDLCASASERVAARLLYEREGTPFASWPEAVIQYFAQTLPFLVQGYFLDLTEESTALDGVKTSLRRFGAERARAGVDLEGFLQAAVSSRSEILDAVIDELDSKIDAETKLSLYCGLMHMADQLFAQYLLGYINDRTHMVALDTSGQTAAEHERRDFLRGLMHDIRSPLTLMSGWANTLLRSDDRIDAETRRRALETIVKAARQVGSLTENLLELDLIEGANGIEAIDFDAVDRVGELLIHKGIKDAVLEGAAEAVIHADPEIFDRVLTNLLENALTHGSTPIRFAVERRADSIVISIEDAGSVDPDVVKHAFEGRVHSSKGFGLGLHATHQLIGAMGGTIALVRADPTTFEIALPLGP